MRTFAMHWHMHAAQAGYFDDYIGFFPTSKPMRLGGLCFDAPGGLTWGRWVGKSVLWHVFSWTCPHVTD